MPIAGSVRETWLHRVNPSFKLVLCVAMFVLVLLTDNINVLANATWMYVALVAAASGQPMRRLLLLSAPFALMFVSSATSMIFFGKGDTTWYRLGVVHITEESFYRGIHIGLKTVDMALIGMLFGFTTSPVAMFYSLMQQLRLSPKYAYSFMAALRLMPMVAAEFRTLQMALKVRGVRTPRGVKGWFVTLKRFSIPLLSQSIRRAQRIAVAMEAKRFSSSAGRTYYYVLGWSANDALLIVAVGFLWGAAAWIGLHYPYFSIGDVRYNIS
ncbi:energy-coupling factor transporter transmembrane component T family protein [Paenibacillus allorhizosphaerae]|uniref:HMP/thiamine permease protein YkoC n=1 Tax=Paenibacillus allorhizosphaerae TaxID=2849866 RepID=A0ABN7TMT5_9BACL|nr:energy-coupling factor transporter transmembrane component T [Paenibacillus allorhizosphaerae]CAG7647669.1 Putative HMP/thiamine permease protein YkoC [Paenibacillus allorhizosphaerae]